MIENSRFPGQIAGCFGVCVKGSVILARRIILGKRLNTAGGCIPGHMLDKLQCQIHSGRHPGRGPDIAVFNDSLFDNLNVFQFPQLLKGQPVGSCFFTLQQSAGIWQPFPRDRPDRVLLNPGIIKNQNSLCLPFTAWWPLWQNCSTPFQPF